ncbi:MAG: TolB family protein [Allorhizobium sp.]
MRSSVEIYTLASRSHRVVWQTGQLVEAPNWAPDGSHLLINGEGLVYRLPLAGGGPLALDTDFAVQCNNDHGISPDGSMIAISDKSQHGRSCIYVLPAEGGTPRQVTQNVPSYWHGWSPDGKRFAYCGIRDDIFDIYTIGAAGGAETRLTFGEGRNDGPDYAPDGRWIYFNSSRSGTMQIYRMHPDGRAVARLTSDGFGDWFPHPSPAGNKVLFLSYDAGVSDHPRDKHIRLRLMDTDGGNIETLFELFGGQGTINVPCWAPDGSAFAYVRYFPVAE